MSDHYVQTCFAFDVTANEARMLLQAAQAAEELSSNFDVPSLTRFWCQLPEDFRAIFPPTDEDPWSGFTAIFPDPEYPTFGAKFEIVNEEQTPQRMMVSGDQFDPDATAELIAVIVKDTLPVIATWSSSCSKLRLDDFHGGAFRVDSRGITFVSSHDIYDNRRFEPKLVLTTYNEEPGPLFWNKDTGFGPLKDATFYTQSEADALGTVIANDEPEWLELPDMATQHR